jgi:hypothetical protein
LVNILPFNPLYYSIIKKKKKKEQKRKEEEEFRKNGLFFSHCTC